MAIFVPSTDVDDIRIPNHAMIKKKLLWLQCAWEKNNLTPGYIGVKLHRNIT